MCNNSAVVYNMHSFHLIRPLTNKITIENGFKISLRKDQAISRICKRSIIDRHEKFIK